MEENEEMKLLKSSLFSIEDPISTSSGSVDSMFSIC